jgi:hypothetical protein
MKTFLDSLSNGEITLIASLLSALIAATVSFLTTRYTLKHGPNYEKQMEGLRETIGSLARTQEELRKQQAEQAERDRERYEAAQWRPTASIINVDEGREHVNKLSLVSTDKFRLLEVSLLSDTGAKVHEFPVQMNAFSDPVVAQNVPIPHSVLVQLAKTSPTYFQFERFEGAVRYTVERDGDSPVKFTGEVKFSASATTLGNTRWFHLVG